MSRRVSGPCAGWRCIWSFWAASLSLCWVRGSFFVCASLATSPPSHRLVCAQLVAWNGGTVLVAVGVSALITPLLDAGGMLIAIGLVPFAGGLRGMQRRSLQRPVVARRRRARGRRCLRDRSAFVGSGWLELTAAAALLGVNLLASLRAASEPLGLPARLIALGQTPAGRGACRPGGDCDGGCGGSVRWVRARRPRGLAARGLDRT